MPNSSNEEKVLKVLRESYPNWLLSSDIAKKSGLTGRSVGSYLRDILKPYVDFDEGYGINIEHGCGACKKWRIKEMYR